MTLNHGTIYRRPQYREIVPWLNHVSIRPIQENKSPTQLRHKKDDRGFARAHPCAPANRGHRS